MYSIGLDVSKLTINCFISQSEVNLVINNNKKSLNQLYVKLKKIYKKEMDNIVFIFEPTGTYSTLLTMFCSEKKIKSFIVNPKQSHNFAKAIAQRNKSDKIDAQSLSRMIAIANVGDVKVPIYNEDAENIKDYMSYYKLIAKQVSQTKNHLESKKYKQANSYIIKSLERTIDALKKEQSVLILKIKKIIESNKFLHQSFLNILTIKGVGEITAIVLLHLFIKYPNANQKQVVSLAGLEPIHQSSGTSVAFKPKISKAGSKLYRSILFMSALSAIRFKLKY